MITDKQKKYLLLKRGVDIVLSGGAIVVLSPIPVSYTHLFKIDFPMLFIWRSNQICVFFTLFFILFKHLFSPFKPR